MERNLEMKSGVFSGRKWALISFRLDVIDRRRRANQVGAPHLKVMNRWDVRVVEYGAAPHIFREMIDRNVE